MPIAFNDLKVSDGQITEVVIRGDEAIVHLRDWQERNVAVTFDEVIGIEGLGAIGVDLSHVEESIDDPLILKACRAANEQPAYYRCFSLYSGWTNEPLLRVVARRSLLNWDQ